MRPSMRLPLREVKSVCSSCRLQPGHRISPLGQVRHYASDSPGFLERARRKLWGTDTPPGPADPYSGSQIMPQPDLNPDEANPEDEFSLSGRPQPEDPANLNWLDLTQVGYLPQNQWKSVGSKRKADRVKPYRANAEPMPLSDAAHEAAVSIGLKQILGEEIAARFTRSEIQKIGIEGSAPRWGDRLRFPNKEIFESKIAGKITDKERLRRFKPWMKDGQLQAPIQTTSRSTIDTLPITGGQAKFDYYSHIAYLTGRRVPDSTISSSTTVGQSISECTALWEQSIPLTPKILTQKMQAKPLSPNVKILNVRQTRYEKDEDLGRKKAIVSALYTNGMITEARRPRKAK